MKDVLKLVIILVSICVAAIACELGGGVQDQYDYSVKLFSIFCFGDL